MEYKHILFNNSISNIDDFLTIKKYNKNEVIYNESDVCNNLVLVFKGEVHISTFTYTNNEYNIRILNEGDTFGEALLFSKRNKYLGNIIAYKESIVGFINKNDLLKLFNIDNIVLNNFLEILSNKLLQSQNKIKILSQKSVRDKIMFYLYNEAKRSRSNIIPIKSKEQLALLFNIPRPSLSRELINLKNAGLIDYNKKYISIKKVESIK